MATMLLGQYMVVRCTPDERNYTYWVVDPAQGGPAMPAEPPAATGNRTTSAATMGTNIQNALPTLSS